MKIINVIFDAGTMSAPMFLDVLLEDGTKQTYRGKQAKRFNAEKRFVIGEEFVAP